jgi:ABC-type Fe3+/spermidine/putrescine transport system ATPase subunit
LALSDRILVMDRGVVQQVGAPEAIYRQPANEFVATFVGQCNVLRATVTERIEKGRYRLEIDGAGRTRCSCRRPDDRGLRGDRPSARVAAARAIQTG